MPPFLQPDVATIVAAIVTFVLLLLLLSKLAWKPILNALKQREETAVYFMLGTLGGMSTGNVAGVTAVLSAGIDEQTARHGGTCALLKLIVQQARVLVQRHDVAVGQVVVGLVLVAVELAEGHCLEARPS